LLFITSEYARNHHGEEHYQRRRIKESRRTWFELTVDAEFHRRKCHLRLEIRGENRGKCRGSPSCRLIERKIKPDPIGVGLVGKVREIDAELAIAHFCCRYSDDRRHTVLQLKKLAHPPGRESNFRLGSRATRRRQVGDAPVQAPGADRIAFEVFNSGPIFQWDFER
jgi:hypothetical protein